MKQIGKPGFIRWLLCAAGLALLPLPHQAASVALEGQPDIRRDATVNAIEAAMPSVVNIATSSMVEYRDFYDELRREFFGQPPARRRTEEQVQSLGSGVIIDEDGYILTNWHVVRSGTRVQVKLSDGRLYEADKIVATTKSDVALLKLRAKPGEKFKAVKLAPDEDLLLGETVIALGNPFGLGGSVSRGILSSKTRRPESGNEPLNVADWLQTDAAINPGNSGGPLVNLRGELIGISVAVYRQAQGIGFAIPVKQVSAALSQFFSPEVNYSLWFGATLKPTSFPLEIASVQPGSPADKAGLKPAMQVVQINGKTPRSVVDFNEQVVTGEGQTATLTVVENGRRRPVQVKMVPFEDLIRQRTGLTLQEITPQMAARLRLRDGQGLLIEKVERGSPAATAELKEGMLVTGFNQTEPRELRDVGLALIGGGTNETAKISVIIPQAVGSGLVQLRQGVAEIKLR
jgi:serine protease Do